MFEEENKPAPTLREYWEAFCRRRWYFIGPLFGCWAIVFAVSWFLPAQFRSETLILVEQQKVPEQYVVPNVATDLQERLQSMTQQILSRTRLQRIIDQFKLYASDRDRLTPDELVDRMRKDIKIELVEAPGHRGELTAFRIYYASASPRLAQQVASQLTSLFIDENLQSQQQQSETTTQFLSSELDDARQSLSEQETKVREFKARYLGELPSQMQSNVQVLTGLQAQQQNLAHALSQAQQQNLYLESLLAQYRAVSPPDVNSTESLPAIEKELTELRSELADARARYTEEHPDVVRLKGQIAKEEKLRDQVKAELAARSKSPNSQDTPLTASSADLQSLSPMMQVQSQLKANNLQIRDIQHQIKDVNSQIAGYQARLNMTPMREQQLADLTRDYDQSRANYDSLLKKSMQSQLATNLEKRQQGEQFRILDPPSLPEKPYSPNRAEFSLFGLLGGLALGGSLVVIMELMDSRVRREKDLKDVVEAKVLVTLPHISSSEEQSRRTTRRILEWATAVAMLLVMVTANAVTLYKG